MRYHIFGAVDKVKKDGTVTGTYGFTGIPQQKAHLTPQWLFVCSKEDYPALGKKGVTFKAHGFHPRADGKVRISELDGSYDFNCNFTHLVVDNETK